MRKAVRELLKRLMADFYIYLLVLMSVFMAPWVEKYKAGTFTHFEFNVPELLIVGFISLLMMFTLEQQGNGEKTWKTGLARRASAALMSGFFWHTII